MPFKISPDGSITADSADEAIELSIKLLVAIKRSAAMPQTPAPQQPAAKSAGIDPTKAKQSLDFLHAIKKSGSTGLSTEGMLHVFSVKAPRGLGGKTGMVRGVLEQLDFDVESVYEKTRTPDGKVFTAGQNMDAAIAACSKWAAI